MANNPIISLCIPTYGVIEWVFPVLDSIYSQKIDESLFEVIVTDNGNNDDFQLKMIDYAKKHENIVYKKNNSHMFYNQLEALSLANGEFFKFVNHRAAFLNGALGRMIDVIKNNIKNKPVIYFSNGELDKDLYMLRDFDSFVATLGRYISWTTGVGIWKSDYQKLPKNLHVDNISPHSCILFSERKKELYIIDNVPFSKEVDLDQTKKGEYDLFKAFAVEELLICLNLYVDGDITANTFKKVKNDYRLFNSEAYWQYVIRKNPCSYDLSGFDSAMNIFFGKYQVILGAYCVGCKQIIRRIRNFIKQ